VLNCGLISVHLKNNPKYKMKNLGLLIGLTSILALTSCSNSTAPEAEATETHSTTTTTTTTNSNDDGTSISVDKDGFEVGKKDGNSETEVKVSTDKVEIKTK